MDNPLRTETIPEDQQAGVYNGPHVVTALCIRGTGIIYPMLAAKLKFSLGQHEDCDICVDRRHVSHSHALLERRNGRISVTDLASKGGIKFAGCRATKFDIGPGDSFFIGETEFVALSDEMQLYRPLVAEILGPQRMADIDELLMKSVNGPHVLLCAEPGCDQERLGRAIHRMSLNRAHDFVRAQPGNAQLHPTPQLVAQARHGTLLLRTDAPGLKWLDPAFVEALTRPDAEVRVIICAPTLIEAIHLVTEKLAADAYRVAIPPLRTRSSEITSLFERWFIDRQSRYRFSDFKDADQAALRAYRWPGNLEELRDVADTLIQLAPYASSRKAEEAGVDPKTNINRWLAKYDVSMPLLRERATDSAK